ncbi:MAG: hypothetical protein K5988_09805 [Lachnospiraceae bacterium]|nr:hypothetical protein [Lachnospiraceae bacterium]
MESSTQTLIFPLTDRSVRQVFDYETDTVTFRLMYDSGARIPVWCSDDEFLLKAFPDAKKTDITARVTGHDFLLICQDWIQFYTMISMRN